MTSGAVATTVGSLLAVGLLALIALLLAKHNVAKPLQTRSGPARLHAGVSRTVRTETHAPKPSSPPAAPRYLAELSYKGGSEPDRGEVEIAGHKFKKSIFWEEADIPASVPGNTCTEQECRSVFYVLEGKYQHFTALVGGTTGQSDEAFKGHWWVILDGMIEQGSFALNRAPVAIEIPVSGVYTLELRISAEKAYSNELTLAWGEARVF